MAEDEARQLRLSGPARSAIIAYGIAAFAFIVPQSATGSRTMLIVGFVVQAGVLLPRVLAKRRIEIVELIADGITVFLFALATYLGILGHAAAI